MWKLTFYYFPYPYSSLKLHIYQTTESATQIRSKTSCIFLNFSTSPLDHQGLWYPPVFLLFFSFLLKGYFSDSQILGNCFYSQIFNRKIQQYSDVTPFIWSVSDCMRSAIQYFLVKYNLRFQRQRFEFNCEALSLTFYSNLYWGNCFHLFYVDLISMVTTTVPYLLLTSEKYNSGVNQEKLKELIPVGIYLLKVSSRKTRTKVWNMFKVNNKDAKTMPSFWCLYC